MPFFTSTTSKLRRIRRQVEELRPESERLRHLTTMSSFDFGFPPSSPPTITMAPQDQATPPCPQHHASEEEEESDSSQEPGDRRSIDSRILNIQSRLAGLRTTTPSPPRASGLATITEGATTPSTSIVDSATATSTAPIATNGPNPPPVTVTAGPSNPPHNRTNGSTAHRGHDQVNAHPPPRPGETRSNPPHPNPLAMHPHLWAFARNTPEFRAASQAHFDAVYEAETAARERREAEDAAWVAAMTAERGRRGRAGVEDAGSGSGSGSEVGGEDGGSEMSEQSPSPQSPQRDGHGVDRRRSQGRYMSGAARQARFGRVAGGRGGGARGERGGRGGHGGHGGRSGRGGNWI